MSYYPSFPKHFQKDLSKIKKKHPKKEVESIGQEIDKVIEDPTKYVLQTGNMRGIHKAKCGAKTSYRLLFRIYDCSINGDETGDCSCALIERDSEILTDHANSLICNCHGCIQFMFVGTHEKCNQYYKLNKKHFDKSLETAVPVV
jgi:mRNA-degrading endonuclease RelE of RelBE toxin-antitoxin system